ncbi:MAG: DUF4115 domain-containing protein [Novosphingobium sp.]|nr:DUF4115 domain-containing protein [Novosphingobium sp.]
MTEAGGLQAIATDTDAPIPAGEPRRLSVGQTLRAAREAAGLDIKQLSQRTRVTSRHLEALESGDYAALPGRPYALGFSKSYARAVGLDDKAIAEAIRAELSTQAPPPPPRVINQFEVGDPAKTPTRLTTWLALGLTVAIALAGLVFWRSYYLPSADLPSLVGPEEQAPAAASSGQVAVVPLPSAAPSGPVVFTATENAIWVKFYDGQGQQILQKQLAMGESFTVPETAQNPQLWTGRPDALTITVGGQPVPRIAEREGIVKDVPVSAAALLARGTPQAAAPAPGANQGAPAPAPVRTAPRQAGARRTGATPAVQPTAGGATLPAAPAPAAETPAASTGLR